MKSQRSAYEENRLNAEFFALDSAPKMKDYFKSTTHFFTPTYIKDKNTFLDIGGSGGNFAAAIKSEIADINPTVIDPDPNSITKGKNSYPSFEFIQGYFPETKLPKEKYDIVSIQALFPQIPNWKEMLLSLSKHTKKYLNLSLVLKLHGTTIVDKDVSYFYYLDSGERVHQVVHNIHELLNFLCIREMNVKKIMFFGYHTPEAGHNFRCVPNSEQIKGNLMLELFEDESDNPKRMGGAVHKGANNPNYSFFVPEMDIIIDGKKIDPRS
ncbi:MAG: class I SAM-dependent methyltransferase [Oligoflexia bacterium]|nr:class I SAM-dependent methyltransferase [Oligoflexia bacterium]